MAKRIEYIARAIRLIIGIWLIAAGIIYKSPIWLAGIFPIYWGIANKCPSFLPNRKSSCSIISNKSVQKTQENNFKNL